MILEVRLVAKKDHNVLKQRIIGARIANNIDPDNGMPASRHRILRPYQMSLMFAGQEFLEPPHITPLAKICG